MGIVSIKDVAKTAQVSISTVSNVLNGTKYVSEELSKKVMDTVEKLGYSVDPIARNMKMKHTKTIGVLTVDICGLFYPYILKGIYEVAENYGYKVLIYDTNATKDAGSARARELDGFSFFNENRVDGIIFSSMVSEDIVKEHIQELQSIAASRKDISLVGIECDFSEYDIDSVFCDSYEGAYKATEYLAGLGCKQIGHIAGPSVFKLTQDRLKGYKDAMQAAGMPADIEKMVVSGDYTHQSGYMQAKELMKNMPELDAIFVGNDQMAVGACRAILEAKKRIPQDVKIMGYDNVFLSSVVEPSLSSIHVRKKHMGKEAAKLLLNRIEEKEQQKVVRMQMETNLVIRKSTQEDAPSDWESSEW